MSGTSKCTGCLWCGSPCEDGEGCENYSTLDGSDDVAYYNATLKENSLEYEQLIAEFSDNE